MGQQSIPMVLQRHSVGATEAFRTDAKGVPIGRQGVPRAVPEHSDEVTGHSESTFRSVRILLPGIPENEKLCLEEKDGSGKNNF